jgi:hypothetical protein
MNWRLSSLWRDSANVQPRAAPLAVLGFLSLTLGVLLYLADRPVERTYFLPDTLTTILRPAGLFGLFGQWLPGFLHVYAFILLTVAIAAPRGRQILSVCAAWFAVDALFECGQHAAIAPRLAALAPDWFQGIPVLENTASYFMRGVFDPLDILFIALGAVAAYATIRSTELPWRPACTH